MTTSNKEDTTSEDDSPIDHCNLVNMIALLLGTGTLLAYNVLITCSDYLTHEFPGHPRLMFVLVPVLCVPNFLGLVSMIRFGTYFSFTTKISLSFLLTFIILVLIPLILSKFEMDEQIQYILLLIFDAIVGVLTAVTQCSVIAFVSLLPSKYIQSVLAGQAMSGILVCVIRIFTKIYFLNDVVAGGLIYFIIGSIFTSLCAVSFLVLKKTAFVKYHLEECNSRSKLKSNSNSNQSLEKNETQTKENMQVTTKTETTRMLKNGETTLQESGEKNQLLRRMDTPHSLANYVMTHEHELYVFFCFFCLLVFIFFK